MRAINSVKNAVIAFIMNFITITIGFVAQKVFVITLGNEYLGINGLFNNILSVLAVVELGFGSAIVCNLYKPVAENNKKEINLLMNFYKKVYRVIAIVILILGISIMPFLKYIVGEVSIKENIVLLFFLALLDIVFSYMLTYKRSILYANQKNYITNIVHTIYIILLNCTQMLFLYLTHNFIFYLIIKIIFRVLENLIITTIANKMYPYICDRSEEKIDKEIKDDINQKVKGLLFHRIGLAFVLGTDNIIISKFLGVVTVGLYSNYSMIINAVTNLLGQVFSSITAVIGNLLVDNNPIKSYDIYKKMLLLNSWIFCWASASIFCVIQPFITLWMGENYLISIYVVAVLVLNFYIVGMRKTSNTFKEAAGVFYEDRFVPIVESLINIIFSICLVKILGLIGVFIGTTISSLVLFLYSYPIFVYKKLFKRTYLNFLIEHFKYMLISIFAVALSAFICNIIIINNLIIKIVIYFVIAFIIPNIIYYVIFRKTKEFLYYKNLLNMLKDKYKKNKNI